ncbi:MAG: porin [Rhodobacteraceae bacterium]|nr:porin [Paracoccaceae bacterium]
MRKLIVFASALALSSGMAFAMEEAPSVAVGGSGKIGIKSVDDSSNPDAEQFKLVRAYKVTFDSTGTTDGGLMFGAGMSIRDDTGEKDVTNDEGEKVQGPAVKGSYVFVGGADGSWKLQFGGNDPGIDLAGGFGIADDHFGGENDVSMALSGSFGNTSFRITAAAPDATGDGDNDWSVGVSHSINTISVGVGMDSESGLAIGVGTDLSGVSTYLYWSKSEFKNVDFNQQLAEPLIGIFPQDQVLGTQKYTGLGVKASMSAGEGATFSVGYSTLKLEQVSDSIPFGREGTAKTKKIEVDFSYDLGGGATLSVGIDKEDKQELTDVGQYEIEESDITTLEAAIAFTF